MKNLRFLTLAIALGYIIKNMATQKQVEAALDKVEEVLTTEIEQIKKELEKVDNVPDSVVDRLTALSTRISGIVADPVAAAEGGEGSAAAGDKPTGGV